MVGKSMMRVWKLEGNSWEFSPFSMWILGMDVGSSGLVANAYWSAGSWALSSGNPNLADPEENPDFWFFCQHPRLFRFACWTHVHADWLLHSIKTFWASTSFFPPIQPGSHTAHLLFAISFPRHSLSILFPLPALCFCASVLSNPS